jgi:hypothetical protein
VDPQNPSDSVLYREVRADILLFNTIPAAIWGSIGIGLITNIIVRAKNTPRRVKNAVESESWRAWSDWAAGEIMPSESAHLIFPVVLAATLWWTLASLPVLSRFLVTFRQIDSEFRWLTFALPIVILCMLGVLVYQSLRATRYGMSVLRLASTPGVIGRQLAGIVYIPRVVNSDEGFLLTLRCIKTVGRGRGSRKQELWQDQQAVVEPLLDRMANTTGVPVSFSIPSDCEPSSGTNHVEWQLDCTAKMTGVDYKTRFDVPVFRTAESSLTLDSD